jgi:hypothetical protein
MLESSQYVWQKMVCAALLEGKDTTVLPYAGIEAVRLRAERKQNDVLAIEALTRELEIFVSQLSAEENKEYSDRLNAAEEKRLTLDSDWHRRMRRGE